MAQDTRSLTVSFTGRPLFQGLEGAKSRRLLAFANAQAAAVKKAADAGDAAEAIRLATGNPWNPAPTAAQAAATAATPQGSAALLDRISGILSGKGNTGATAVPIAPVAATPPPLPPTSTGPPPLPTAPSMRQDAPLTAPPPAAGAGAGATGTSTPLDRAALANVAAVLNQGTGAGSSPSQGGAGPFADPTGGLIPTSALNAVNAALGLNSATQAPAATPGFLDFLSAPITLPLVGDVPTWGVGAAVGLVAFGLWRRSRGAKGGR